MDRDSEELELVLMVHLQSKHCYCCNMLNRDNYCCVAHSGFGCLVEVPIPDEFGICLCV